MSALLRENKENCSLLKEEAEGLKRKLERTAKAKEDLVTIELEKEVNSVSLLLFHPSSGLYVVCKAEKVKWILYQVSEFTSCARIKTKQKNIYMLFFFIYLFFSRGSLRRCEPGRTSANLLDSTSGLLLAHH